MCSAAVLHSLHLLLPFGDPVLGLFVGLPDALGKEGLAGSVSYPEGIGNSMIKEAIHIQTTPIDRLISRDKGAEIPGCWVATVNALAQKWL